MKRRLIMTAAVFSLAFAGFGCSKAPAETTSPAREAAATPAATEVDRTVDDILDDAVRADQSTDPSGDLEYLDDDQSVVGDYMITSYETE
jgi:hypothetical protein